MNNVGLIIILEIIIVVCGGAYLRQKNPVGFNRVITDFEQLVSSAPGSNTATVTAPTAPETPATVAPAPASTPVTPAPASTPAAAAVPTTTTPLPPADASPPAAPAASGSPAPAPAAPPPPATGWTPPAVMPARPNWTWTTVAGRVYTNVKVLSIDSDSVMIMYDGGGERVPLAYLSSSLRKLLTAPPAAAPSVAAAPAASSDVAPATASPALSGAAPAATSSTPAPALAPAAAPVASSDAVPDAGPSVIGHLVAGDLVRCSADGLQPVNDAVLAPARYIALYYSAQWNPPSHTFTPKLVQFYNSFKPAHPDFDVIFVSEDHDAQHMEDYMREMTMPWLAVNFGKLEHGESFKGPGIQSYVNSGIPDLVLVDSAGKVLSDSWRNGQYVGPELVVDDIQTMVK